MSERIHIIGIGGAGMSGIARILLARGRSVSGSDAKDSRRLQSLVPLGAEVFVGHDAQQLRIAGQLPSTVVVSTAISPENVELKAAIELGIPVLRRADQLAQLLQGYRVISVAGTHGKTTTTSMTTVALQHCGVDPSFVIGSEINESGSNAHHGSGPDFVVEADESDGTFLVLPTFAGIITNVEADHLNYWESLDAIYDAFVDFAVNTSNRGGYTVICQDDPGAALVANRARELGARIYTYGISSSADAQLTMLDNDGVGARFTIDFAGQTYGPISLKVPGVHNALNATAAFIATLQLNQPPQKLVDGLCAFSGTHRRFEFRGQVNSIRVFDDYAHHPTEIEAVLKAARSVAGSGRVLVAFQAHHYYRTALFSKEFGAALGLADFAVVLEVYAPGETPIPGASGQTMAGNVPLPKDQVVFEPSWSAVAGHLASAAKPGDIIMTLGAGDIGMLCPQILELLEVQS